MGDAGMLVGWDRVASGREAVAEEMFNEMVTWLRAQHAAGRIQSFEPVVLGAHGGRLNGFFLVRGEQAGLDHLRNSEEFLALVVRANKNLEGFCVLRAHFGREVEKLRRLYATL